MLLAFAGSLPEPWVVSDGTDPAALRSGLWTLVYPAQDYRVLDPEFARAAGEPHLTDALLAEHLAALAEGRAVLVIDVTNEGPPASQLGIDFLVEHLAGHGVPPSRVIFASMNAALSDELAPRGLTALMVDALTLRLADLFQNGPLAEPLDHLILQAPRRSWNQPMMCLNATPRAHRVALMACLLADGFVDRNFVSWGGWGHLKASGLGPTGDEARTLLGEENEDAWPFVEQVLRMSPVTFESHSRQGNDLAFVFPESLFAATSLSLVSESTVYPDVWRISEKTIKALAAGHPTMVWGNANARELIALYDFDPVDHEGMWAYDAIPSGSSRLASLRSILRQQLAGDLFRPADHIETLISNMVHARHHLLESLMSRMVRPLFDEVLQRVSQ